MKIRLVFFLVVFSLSLSACTWPVKTSVGMWSECQNYNETLNHPDRLIAMIDQARAAGINEIFLQVFRGGQSWYPSRLVEQYPEVKADFDPLRAALDEAHNRGIKIHAWVNCFNFALNHHADIFQRLGYRVLIEDNFGRCVAAYLPPQYKERFFIEGPQPRCFYEDADPAARLDTDGLWIDPGDEMVQRYLLEVIGELVRNYPDLDGVHLDYVRYPYSVPIKPVSRMKVGIDFGYNEASRRAFTQSTGLHPPFKNDNMGSGDRFDDWRRRRITGFVTRIKEVMRQQNPGMKLSAAVLGWADRAYLSAFQDWRSWVTNGHIDLVVVMNYTKDAVLSEQISHQSTAARNSKGKIYIGLGAYTLLNDLDNLKTQIRSATAAQVDGIVFFSYDNMIKNPEVFKLVDETL